MPDIVITNPSSPGASMTQNTNNVILCCHRYIEQHRAESMLFIQFRSALSQQYQLNDNNNRNIYPLLRNMKFVQYEPQNLLQLDSFFTAVGSAYVKVLLGIEDVIDSPDLDEETRRIALQKLNSMKECLCFAGLGNIIKNPEVNYGAECVAYLRFLRRYRTINKIEAALLVYFRQQYPDNYLEQMAPAIENFRNGRQDFRIQVNVRNDEQAGDAAGQPRRLADINFFTSYGYIIGLIKGAGLVVEEERTFELVAEKKNQVDELLREV